MMVDEKFVKKRCGMDWDGVSYGEALKRFHRFIEVEKPVRASLFFSPVGGFHCVGWFDRKVDTFLVRLRWGDDWRRLELDWLRDFVYDVLWFRKTFHRKSGKFSFEQVKITDWDRDKKGLLGRHVIAMDKVIY